jgi:hypothetical protein
MAPQSHRDDINKDSITYTIAEIRTDIKNILVMFQEERAVRIETLERIGKLEQWRFYLIGYSSAIASIVAIFFTWLARK